MRFYHGTSKATWQQIQLEGVLWGIHYTHPEHTLRRYTYLSPHIEVAQAYGDIVLEVDYSPTGKNGIDNYGFSPPPGQTCWQFSVFNPIPLIRVRRIQVITLVLTEIELESILMLYGTLMSAGHDADADLDSPIESIYFKALEVRPES